MLYLLEKKQQIKEQSLTLWRRIWRQESLHRTMNILGFPKWAMFSSRKKSTSELRLLSFSSYCFMTGVAVLLWTSDGPLEMPSKINKKRLSVFSLQRNSKGKASFRADRETQHQAFVSKPDKFQTKWQQKTFTNQCSLFRQKQRWFRPTDTFWPAQQGLGRPFVAVVCGTELPP